MGLKIKDKKIYLEPCVPIEWDNYSIQYKYGESVYNINVKNKNKTNEVQSLKLNNNEISEKCVKLIDNNSINNIEIII